MHLDHSLWSTPASSHYISNLEKTEIARVTTVVTTTVTIVVTTIVINKGLSLSVTLHADLHYVSCLHEDSTYYRLRDRLVSPHKHSGATFG